MPSSELKTSVGTVSTTTGIAPRKYNGTSSVNCTRASCVDDLKICRKESAPCVDWWACLSQHCQGSMINGTDDSCFTICLFQVDADGPTLMLYRCAMENKCVNPNKTATVTADVL